MLVARCRCAVVVVRAVAVDLYRWSHLVAAVAAVALCQSAAVRLPAALLVICALHRVLLVVPALEVAYALVQEVVQALVLEEASVSAVETWHLVLLAVV